MALKHAAILMAAGMMNIARQSEKPSEALSFIPKGARISCPHCKEFIAKTTETIRAGMSLKSSYLEGPGIKPGAPTKCTRCGMPWFIKETGQIHLEAQGWFPEHVESSQGGRTQ